MYKALKVSTNTYFILDFLRKKKGMSFSSFVDFLIYFYVEKERENIPFSLNYMLEEYEKKSKNFLLKSQQSKLAEQIMLVQNVYKFIYSALYNSFERPDIESIIRNIEISIERCKLNGWVLQEEQLNNLKKFIEEKKSHDATRLIEDIRIYIGR